MIALGHYKDRFDTAITTPNRSIGFDLPVIVVDSKFIYIWHMTKSYSPVLFFLICILAWNFISKISVRNGKSLRRCVSWQTLRGDLSIIWQFLECKDNSWFFPTNKLWRELSIWDTRTVAAPFLPQAILIYLTPLHTPRGVNNGTWAFGTHLINK